jgi:hypothetical protein
MFGRTVLACCVVTAFSLGAYAGDVAVKDGDKSGKAKVGDTVEIQISNPALAKMKEKFKVEANPGKILGKATITDEVHKAPNGQPMAGGGYKSIKMKTDAKGKTKVKVSWEQDGKAESREIETTIE